MGIATSLGMCLSLFPLIFLKIRTKRRHKNNLIEKNLSDLDSQSSKDPRKTTKIIASKILIIFFSAFLDFSQKFESFLSVSNIAYNFWIFDMVFLGIFSYFILKTKLYKHQYISLFILIILGIVQNIVQLIDDNDKFYNLFRTFLIEAIYSLIIVLNKYVMEYCYCLPYEVIFYQGLFSFIVNSVLLVIFTDVEMNKKKFQKIEYKGKMYLDNYHNYLDGIDSSKILVFILLMICKFIFSLFACITVKMFTPSHVALILFVGEISFIFNEKGSHFIL
jgi:hypothetical protein